MGEKTYNIFDKLGLLCLKIGLVIYGMELDFSFDAEVQRLLLKFIAIGTSMFAIVFYWTFGKHC